MRLLILPILFIVGCANPSPQPPPPVETPTSDALCGELVDAICERARMCAGIDPGVCGAAKSDCSAIEGITPAEAAGCLAALDGATCLDGVPADCYGIASPSKTPQPARMRVLEL